MHNAASADVSVLQIKRTLAEASCEIEGSPQTILDSSQCLSGKRPHARGQLRSVQRRDLMTKRHTSLPEAGRSGGKRNGGRPTPGLSVGGRERHDDE